MPANPLIKFLALPSLKTGSSLSLLLFQHLWFSVTKICCQHACILLFPQKLPMRNFPVVSLGEEPGTDYKKNEEREVKKLGEDMFWRNVLKSLLAIVKAINTLRLRHVWEQGLCIPFLQTLFLSTCSPTLMHIFNFPLLLQEGKREQNFQDLNIVLAFCSSDRNSFPPPLCLIRERDSIITDITATQKQLRS